jgi:hypothetical protein
MPIISTKRKLNNDESNFEIGVKADSNAPQIIMNQPKANQNGTLTLRFTYNNQQPPETIVFHTEFFGLVDSQQYLHVLDVKSGDDSILNLLINGIKEKVRLYEAVIKFSRGPIQVWFKSDADVIVCNNQSQKTGTEYLVFTGGDKSYVSRRVQLGSEPADIAHISANSIQNVSVEFEPSNDSNEEEIEIPLGKKTKKIK